MDKLAVAGATGAVGREVCRLVETHNLSLDKLKLLASARSAGTTIDVNGQSIEIEELTPASFEDVDVAIFSAGGDRSREYAPHANDAGCVVIDNSSAFRMDPAVPLVIPEINPHDLNHHKGIIANPNCSTIIMNMVVWPLHQVIPVERIVVSTYQAASGAGAAAMEELENQTRQVLDGAPPTTNIFPVPCAFNLFSHNTPIGEDGYNTEERKMIQETHKIFHDDSIRISATCIRVPVLRAHSESINLTFREPMAETRVREILADAPGVVIVDDREANRFPMPIDASGREECLVGRIRQDKSQPDGRGVEMFVAGDQLLKGAALNAVQIYETLIRT